MRTMRDGLGGFVLFLALGTLFWGLFSLRRQDFLSAVLLVFTGLSLLRAGLELLRPSIGE